MLVPTRYALAVTLTAVALLAGCAPAAEQPEASPVPSARAEAAATLTDAAARCGLEGDDGVKLNAEGTNLVIDTKGPRETSGPDVAAVSCVLTALEVPKDIQSMMKFGTSTAEPHDASWGGYGFAWNYDPETHFRITINQT